MSRIQDREIGKIKRKTSKRKNIKRKIKPKIKQCSFYKCKWNKVIYCQEKKKNIHSQKWYNKIIKLKHKKDSKMKTKRKHGQWYMKDKINSIYELSRRRQWHPTPVLLPGKSHGWRSLKDCSPWGRWGSDTTERLHFHFSLSCIGEGNGNPLQCSCLENPRDGGAWWAAVYGVPQSRTRLKLLSSSMN